MADSLMVLAGENILDPGADRTHDLQFRNPPNVGASEEKQSYEVANGSNGPTTGPQQNHGRKVAERRNTRAGGGR